MKKCGPKKMLAGGMVKGKGGPTDDLNIRALSSGESVLPADTTKAIGGPPAVKALIDATHTPVGMADGGSVGGQAADLFGGGSSYADFRKDRALADMQNTYGAMHEQKDAQGNVVGYTQPSGFGMARGANPTTMDDYVRLAAQSMRMGNPAAGKQFDWTAIGEHLRNNEALRMEIARGEMNARHSGMSSPDYFAAPLAQRARGMANGGVVWNQNRWNSWDQDYPRYAQMKNLGMDISGLVGQDVGQVGSYGASPGSGSSGGSFGTGSQAQNNYWANQFNTQRLNAGNLANQGAGLANTATGYNNDMLKAQSQYAPGLAANAYQASNIGNQMSQAQLDRYRNGNQYLDQDRQLAIRAAEMDRERQARLDAQNKGMTDAQIQAQMKQNQLLEQQYQHRQQAPTFQQFADLNSNNGWRSLSKLANMYGSVYGGMKNGGVVGLQHGTPSVGTTYDWSEPETDEEKYQRAISAMRNVALAPEIAGSSLLAAAVAPLADKLKERAYNAVGYTPKDTTQYVDESGSRIGAVSAASPAGPVTSLAKKAVASQADAVPLNPPAKPKSSGGAVYDHPTLAELQSSPASQPEQAVPTASASRAAVTYGPNDEFLFRDSIRGGAQPLAPQGIGATEKGVQIRNQYTPGGDTITATSDENGKFNSFSGVGNRTQAEADAENNAYAARLRAIEDRSNAFGNAAIARQRGPQAMQAEGLLQHGEGQGLQARSLADVAQQGIQQREQTFPMTLDDLIQKADLSQLKADEQKELLATHRAMKQPGLSREEYERLYETALSIIGKAAPREAIQLRVAKQYDPASGQPISDRVVYGDKYGAREADVGGGGAVKPVSKADYAEMVNKRGKDVVDKMLAAKGLTVEK